MHPILLRDRIRGHPRDRERGSSTIEYLGVGAVVVALTASVAATVPAVSGPVTDAISTLVCRAAGQDCQTPEGADVDGDTGQPGEPPDAAAAHEHPNRAAAGEGADGDDAGAPQPRAPEERERDRANAVHQQQIHDAIDVVQDPVTRQMLEDYADLRASGLGADDAFAQLRDQWEILEEWHLNPNFDDDVDAPMRDEDVLAIFLISDSLEVPAPGTQQWEEHLDLYEANNPASRDRLEHLMGLDYLDAVDARWRDLLIEQREERGGSIGDLLDILIQQGQVPLP
jgi:hypothetical protein